MISSIINGKVKDWRFEKQSDRYVFYIGDVVVGLLYNLGSRQGWSAIAWYSPKPRIDGFISRYKAANYLAELYEDDVRQ